MPDHVLYVTVDVAPNFADDNKISERYDDNKIPESVNVLASFLANISREQQ